MPVTLIKGIFKPATGVPDGDTIRFAPFDSSVLFKLQKKSKTPRLNQNNGTISLRYEGIDAMEKDAIEPFASKATENNLRLLGLKGATDETEGYILASHIGTNGRAISFVFPGTTDEKDGSKLFLEQTRMKDSINYKLLEMGLVYPLFYDTLYPDLRQVFASATRSARQSGLGVWPKDRTKEGVTWKGASSLSKFPPIFPKLWRKLENYTQVRDFKDRCATLANFQEYLQVKREHNAWGERIFIVSESRSTNLHDIVEIDNNKISLPYLPEDLIFQS